MAASINPPNGNGNDINTQAFLMVLSQMQGSIDAIEHKIDLIVPRSEHQAKWDEQERRFKAVEEDVRDLQKWRDTFYQMNGDQRVNMVDRISAQSTRVDDRQISVQTAVLMALFAGAIAIIVALLTNH